MVTSHRDQKLKRVARQRQKGIVVVLEDIYDPHNALAVLRTCDVFGIQSVYFCFERQEYYNPGQLGKSSSSSANKWVDIKTFSSTQECIDKLRSEEYTLLATCLDEDAKDLMGSELTDQRLALFLGNEHAGLSGKVLEQADKKLKIPMFGMIESLNLSVSAAIFLYEITRQRSSSDKDHSLDKERAEELYRDFLER